LISFLNNPKRKYFVNSDVFDKHYKAEFIKHVFPRFESPHTPQQEFFFKAFFNGTIKNYKVFGSSKS